MSGLHDGPPPALLDWLALNEVSVSPKIRIGQFESEKTSRNMGVFATQAIDPNEILCSMPKSALLSRKTCSIGDRPEFTNFCESIAETHPQPDVIVLATIVSHEIRLGRESRWFGYLVSLPTTNEISLPSFWTDSAARRWLAGTDVPRWQAQNGSGSVRTILSLLSHKSDGPPVLLINTL